MKYLLILLIVVGSINIVNADQKSVFIQKMKEKNIDPNNCALGSHKLISNNISISKDLAISDAIGNLATLKCEKKQNKNTKISNANISYQIVLSGIVDDSIVVVACIRNIKCN